MDDEDRFRFDRLHFHCHVPFFAAGQVIETPCTGLGKTVVVTPMALPAKLSTGSHDTFESPYCFNHAKVLITYNNKQKQLVGNFIGFAGNAVTGKIFSGIKEMSGERMNPGGGFKGIGKKFNTWKFFLRPSS